MTLAEEYGKRDCKRNDISEETLLERGKRRAEIVGKPNERRHDGEAERACRYGKSTLCYATSAHCRCHPSMDRKRASFSYSHLMSGMPYLIIAMRSTPKPNA